MTQGQRTVLYALPAMLLGGLIAGGIGELLHLPSSAESLPGMVFGFVFTCGAIILADEHTYRAWLKRGDSR